MNLDNRPKIGLALGGGSARGFAHLGVLKALEEKQIPIDAIAGCSMGAIIGSIYCAGTDLDRLIGLFAALNTKDLIDLVVPRKGLIRGNKFEAALQLLTKDMDFEQLPKPFTCVACDIAAGKIKVFDKGKVYPAVRASMSIPGVFEPKWIDGVMYVDGGVLNTVPVDAARGMGVDIVIGVDVGIHKAEPAEVKETLLDIYMRTSDLTGYAASLNLIEQADILLRPHVGQTAHYSTRDVELCTKIGYETAMERMEVIERTIAQWPSRDFGEMEKRK